MSKSSKLTFAIKGEIELDNSFNVVEALNHLEEVLLKVNELASAECRVELPASTIITLR